MSVNRIFMRIDPGAPKVAVNGEFSTGSPFPALAQVGGVGFPWRKRRTQRSLGHRSRRGRIASTIQLEAPMQRKGSAVWKGGLKDGRGTLSTGSGALGNQPYSFASRFESETNTNPEELIGAAHAGCFSMALSKELESAGLKADSIETTATVTLDKVDGGFAVTAVHLDVAADVPRADAAKFETAANNAKSGCVISKLLNAKITMNAKLRSAARA
jgi:osmotically inducible protein OsmC